MWEVERSEVQRHTASRSHLCWATGRICMVFASNLEELTTQMWWRAVKSPGVCANTLPCFAFALTKAIPEWQHQCLSCACPSAQSSPLLITFVADSSELELMSLTQSTFHKSQPKVHPEDPGSLEIIAVLLDNATGHVELSSSHGMRYKSSCISSCLHLSLRIKSSFQWSSSETVFSHR